jgi:hypothetical protein
VVADSILGLKIWCKYGCKKDRGRWIKDNEGCPQAIVMAKRKEHEDVCPFSTIKCPYGETCPPSKQEWQTISNALSS